MDAGQSTICRFSARITWPASIFAAAATYWLLGGGGAVWVLENFWLSQNVKMPEITREMIKAEVSRRVITPHLFYWN
jgi:hypothetical protein